MQMVIKQILFYLRTLAEPKRYERGHGLLIAMILLTLCLFNPHLNLPNRVFDWLIVIDVTQSMNVRDYNMQDKGVSRLEFVKKSVRESLRALPCGSRVALAMFAERDALNIVHPVEVCAHYSVIDQTLEKLDWRMAWAADSFIAHGAYRAIEQAAKLGKTTRVLFITDGHQAPPANPKYMPSFSGKAGKIKGFIIGSGKLTPSAIPKLDDRNEIAGYWTQEDVQQFGSFGMAETLSVLAMEQGQHDRNSGHGAGADILGGAHLSALDEANLKKIAKQTGLHYLRLEHTQQLESALTQFSMATTRRADTDLRAWFALPALVLILIYILLTFNSTSSAMRLAKMRLLQSLNILIAQIKLIKPVKLSKEKV
jgi:mxaL protein